MPIHHVTYVMPNARNAQRKAIHMLQRSSHTPTQEIKHTPSSPRKRVKVASSRGLVEISASWSCVGTWIKAIFPFSMLSLKNDTSLLCAWFWNEELGSLLHLWHWCCHIEVEHGYTPHQSHAWCM
jgi:hypothetical protein